MSEPDRTWLPIRRAPFRGVSSRTLAGSEPDWNLTGHAEPPAGCPDVLLVLIDDAGFGNPGTFGGPIDTPNDTWMAVGGVRHPAKSLALWAAVLVIACLIAGCGSTVSSAIQHVPSGTVTASPVSPRPVPTSAAAAAPTTAQPSTAPPTTAQPSRAAPTTAQPSRPGVTVTATLTASASASATPEAGSGTSLLWLWILLGVAVVAGLIAWITHSVRRRSATASSRQARLIDAYAKGSALHDAMSVAETQGGLTGSDAGVRWADIQRRADDLMQALYALREQATDPDEQARISDVLVSLQAVRSAMDAERAAGGAGPQQAGVVRSRLSAFESSLRALRGSGQEFS